MELHDIADDIVLEISQKPIVEQLRNLRVSRIFLEKLPSGFGGHLCSGIWDADEDLWHKNWIRDDSVYSISLNKDDSITDWIFTLGHEVGHIFCSRNLMNIVRRAFSIKYQIELPDTINMETPQNIFDRFWDVEYKSEELFCEIFSSLWTIYGRNKKELRDLVSTLSVSNRRIVF